MKKKIFSILIVVLAIFMLTSCINKKYDVTFDYNDGTDNILIVEVKKGETVEKVEDPKKEGFIFLGWYLKDKEYNFDLKIKKNITLVAMWEDKMKDLLYYEYLNDNNPVVTIQVENFGEMKLQLFPEVAENTVNNFLYYVINEKYNNTLFHRVVKGFMIQGGAMQVTKGPIKGDFNSNGVKNDLKHDRGVLSMARTMFPNSATSQFFIMHENTPALDGQYAAFGGLISGFDVLDKIANVPTNSSELALEYIVMTSVTVELNGYLVKEVIYY